MFDSQTYVQGLFVASSALQTLLGGAGHIMAEWPNSFETLPLVSHYEINQYNEAQDFKDNQAKSDFCQMAVDVWSLTGNQAIVEKIDELLQADLWTRYYAAEMFEADPKIYHRNLRYSRTISATDFT